MSAFREWAESPLFAVAATVGMYALSLRAAAAWPRLHPLFLTAGGLIALLLVLDVPYESYAEGGDLISFFLGPATVALAVPLYKRRHDIRRRIGLILASVTVGSAVGIGSAWLLMALFQGSREALVASLPKSATSATGMRKSWRKRNPALTTKASTVPSSPTTASSRVPILWPSLETTSLPWWRTASEKSRLDSTWTVGGSIGATSKKSPPG